MQIPILSGIYTNQDSDVRTAYPRNLIPVPKAQGVSQGYLRPAEGVEAFATGQGADRGGVNWNGEHYRASGSQLVRIASDGAVTVLGTLAGTGQVIFDYSFDYLAIAAGGLFYLFDGSTLQQVTDPDLGTVRDFTWVDGYFLTTDGVNLVVTELTDPFAVNPLKYGSSEADPDLVVAIVKVRNEPHVLNRYTIEVFDNVGGENFPFQRIDGAQVQRGAIGTHAACFYMDAVAFVGGGRNEALAVWIAGGGQSQRLSTREIDQTLAAYSEAELAGVLLESRTVNGHMFLYVHLPDQTLVYDGAASRVMGEPAWFVLSGGTYAHTTYPVRNFTHCHGVWYAGHPSANNIGTLTTSSAHLWGQPVGWEFSTTMVYNEGRGAIVHRLELVALTGRAALGDDPTIWTSYSLDGETFSQERPIKAGKLGQRDRRLAWLQQGTLRQWRVQKFRGNSDAMLSIVRLEAALEPLGA